MSRALSDHISSSFREDAPRPPVPGEEGEAPCHNPSKFAMMRTPQNKTKIDRRGSSWFHTEEKRGWTRGTRGKRFAGLAACSVDQVFAFPSGGPRRQMDLKDTKTLRVAKAIYKRYIENNSIVAKQLKPATKNLHKG
ncbi:hypothetical protein SKAU_G00123620 [Synaphobranchus kaupii]|uniref:Axin-1/2 tankyrase-binding domain-containing protein n=1 Tax=Synaphobranchus kaupii TaxID=118154 RepID=A0A9Q1J2A4_SYNKA|nr:hypothetical protein SKAU_G00123620 [Synaphobranchus kaupii]